MDDESGVNDVLGEERLRRLLAIGRSLVSEFDLDTVLSHVLEAARELTGAHYAALAVLDEERHEIERFLTRGIDPVTHRAIGDPPRGRGILGLLIEDPKPLRLHDLRLHPRSYGFPDEHPVMRSFLGVPIMIHGTAWGNLYLSDKRSGDFDIADEQTAVILASWASIAVENARLYRRLQDRHDALDRTVRNFEAAATITRAVGSETRLEQILELIVKRGRALIDARAMLILLREEEDLSIAACAGDVDVSVLGRRLPIEGSTASDVLRTVRSERIGNVERRLRIASSNRLGAPLTSNQLGVQDPHTALLVPLEFHGRKLGVLLAIDRLPEEIEFNAEQQMLLLVFAASAATAVATAQSVERQRLRDSMLAAERERQRWAHELHDETLQGLAGFQVLIDSALQSRDPVRIEQAMSTLGERIGREIRQLRTLIAELRPEALDERGLQPALESLADDVSASAGIDVKANMNSPEGDDGKDRLTPDAETTVYRIVQEALTNAVKHAGAQHVAIDVSVQENGVEISVNDDGAGFDPDAPREGYGIDGMHERVELANGTLAIRSTPNVGTSIQAWLFLDGNATT